METAILSFRVNIQCWGINQKYQSFVSALKFHNKISLSASAFLWSAGQQNWRVICIDNILRSLNPSEFSGHYMYRTVVTICTARWSLYVPPGLTFNNPTFCPHSVFMCFVCIWEQTAIISLYSINWLVCITETECVYCAVRTGSLNVMQVILCLASVNP
jgi:hypothetical protein